MPYEELAALKDTFSGRIFLVGNGPSLLKLTRPQAQALRQERLFMGSRYCDWEEAPLSPTFYVCTERRQAVYWLETHYYQKPSAEVAKFWIDWQPTPGGWVATPRPPSNAHDVLNYGLLSGIMGNCKNGVEVWHTHHGKDTPVMMAQIARYLGFNRMYLIGCETTTVGETYDPQRQRNMHAPGIMNGYYERAANEVALVDCTPGGTLAQERGGPLHYQSLDEVLGL